jgi:hypothetical protein
LGLTFIVNVGGVVLFSRIMFTLLYGTPKDIVEPMYIDIQKREMNLLNILAYQIIILTVLMYLI